jgi:WD40 repeat protein
MIGEFYCHMDQFVRAKLVSRGRLIKIWDYLSKSCIQTLEGHTSNVSFAIFHPSLPILVSGSEDGTVKIWHSSTYRLENTLDYGLERAWCVAYARKGNDVAFGFDEGAVVVKVSALPFFVLTSLFISDDDFSLAVLAWTRGTFRQYGCCWKDSVCTKC